MCVGVWLTFQWIVVYLRANKEGWAGRWSSEWTSEWVSECMSEWVSGWVGEWVSEWVTWEGGSQWISESASEWMSKRSPRPWTNAKTLLEDRYKLVAQLIWLNCLWMPDTRYFISTCCSYLVCMCIWLTPMCCSISVSEAVSKWISESACESTSESANEWEKNCRSGY